jgi:Chaperone of endosialidase
MQAVVPAPDGGYPGGNTAEGANALFSLTSGIDNNALGFQALYHNATGNYNTAEGFRSLFNNTTGYQNTANGAQALFSNTTANYNTALGVNALYRNTTGLENTAVGVQALFNNTIGDYNTALGTSSLYSNTNGAYNTATGWQALFTNTTGDYNAAHGVHALYNNTTGPRNTAIGYRALYSNTGAGNIALGFMAGTNLTTGDNNIDIGNFGVAGDSRTIRIGNVYIASRTFIAGIRGSTTGNANAVPVLVDSAGQLGTVSSSRRYKNKIKPMDGASDAILALKPVTFHYKSDSTGTPQFGLIAEEVAKVNPDLVVHDENGEIYTVRYDAVNAMLLNEFLKEHRTVQAQQKEIDVLRAELREQRALIQKVNDKVELSKAAPRTVANDQ